MAHRVHEDGPVVARGDVAVVGARVSQVQLDHSLTPAARVVHKLALWGARSDGIQNCVKSAPLLHGFVHKFNARATPRCDDWKGHGPFWRGRGPF